MCREVLISSRFQTVIFAPIYSVYVALATQVRVGVDEGLKHESSIHRDELASPPKSSLTNVVGSRSVARHEDLARALRVALDIP